MQDMPNPEGVEYRGVTVPVEKLDRHDKRLARQAAQFDGDGLDELRAAVYHSPEGYQAYKRANLRLRSLTQETLPGSVKTLVKDAQVFAKDLVNRVKPTPD